MNSEQLKNKTHQKSSNETDESSSNKSKMDNLIKFQPFSMRTLNLDKFPNDAPSYRLNHHRNLMNRAKIGCLTSTSKSLDVLRCCLQESFNQEIDCLMQRLKSSFHLIFFF